MIQFLFGRKHSNCIVYIFLAVRSQPGASSTCFPIPPIKLSPYYQYSVCVVLHIASSVTFLVLLLLQELVLEDGVHGKIRKSLLFKLSQNGVLKLFQKIILVSSPKDQYVPSYSARVQVCTCCMHVCILCMYCGGTLRDGCMNVSAYFRFVVF